MKDFKPLSIQEILNKIDARKNSPNKANELPRETAALINNLDEVGKIAATAMIANKDKTVSATAKKVFLSTFEGITVASVMNSLNTRKRG